MSRIAIDANEMTKVEPAGSIFVSAFACFLLLAPLYRASVLPWPLMLLELASVAFLFAMLVVRPAAPALPRTVLGAALILLAYPLVQLIPLPEAWWRALPGHGPYADSLDLFARGLAGQGDAPIRRSLSVIPSATEDGWLSLLPVLACLLAVGRMRSSDATRLLLFMAAFAALEAVLGLLQVGQDAGSVFYLKIGEAFGAAVGTFPNRNHLAALFAMTLPLVVGLLVYSIRHERRIRRRRKRPYTFDANVFAQRALLFTAGVVILLCLFFTRSRAGIATALVGLACSAVLLPRAHGGIKYTGYIVIGLIGLGMLLALLIGVTPILGRVQAEQLRASLQDHFMMDGATLRAAVEFLPFGSGLSTLPDVLPRFQTGMLAGFVNYAHDDYLQAFMELGLAAPVAIGLLLFAYGKRMVELLREGSRASFTLLQITAGVALLPLILHSLVDFGLHMPALAMWFATLAGVLFHPGAEPERSPAPRPRFAVPASALPSQAAAGAPELLQ